MTTVGIDIGGTFTDVVVMRDDGSLNTTKAPSTPGHLIDGLLAALADAAEREGTDLETLLSTVERIAHGTTAATNAYIERRGADVALITTRGFEDTIIMQRMMGMTAGLSPSELTDYSKRRVPEPLVPRSLIFGVRERIDYRGDVIEPLAEDDIRAAARQICTAGIKAVAICYLWSFKNAAHENRTAEILREELDDVYLSISNELAPRLGEYERTATTVVNSYLGPLIQEYTDVLQNRLGKDRLFLLDSSGGVMTPGEAGRAPVRLLLSGPSGGVTAARFIGNECQHDNIITFDMGGTSTDVAIVVRGKATKRQDTVADKYHLLLPMVDVRAIGAGGGSIARVEEGGYLRIGPQSAGADPGPACYGRAGKLPTVTDADVVLGIINPARFLGGKLTLDINKARDAIQDQVAEPLGIAIEEAAIGIKQIVDTRMADLLRTVTIEHGHDPRQFVLYAFGGAGATHAPAFALDVVNEVYVPASQSVFCAFGAVASDITLTSELAVPKRLSRNGGGVELDKEEIEDIFAGLEQSANTALAEQRVTSENRQLRRFIEICFIRQTKTLSIPFSGDIQRLLEDFLAAYAQRYGMESVSDEAGFELVTFVVEATGILSRPALARYPVAGADAGAALRDNRMVYDSGSGKLVDTAVYDGNLLQPENQLEGPAVVEYDGTTVVLISGQVATINELLGMSIRRQA